MKQSGQKIKIQILTTEPFPIGMAASNRIMSYAKGFAEEDCDISVHSIKPTESNGKIYNKAISGSIDGIYYSYSGGKTTLDQSFITRRFDNIKGVFKICYKLLKEKPSEKTDAIIYYSSSTSRAILIYLVTRIRKIIFLKEENEIPNVRLRNMNFIQKTLFLQCHYILFDGLLLMTTRLIKYFKIEKKVNIPCLHVPMTVDFERFSNIERRNTSTSQYIAYCGVLNNKKDGINLLISAFIILSKEFPNINLYLIGEAASNIEYNQYVRTIDQNHLSKKIILTGRISMEEIPKYLCNATFLVLPRPMSLQAEAGFPTKLGEYLATGNPVVVTRVGEIPNYLTDGLNTFMAEPDNVNSLATKMKAILIDYPKAKVIGENGKKVVLEYFNYQIQTKNILDFIKSIQKSA